MIRHRSSIPTILFFFAFLSSGFAAPWNDQAVGLVFERDIIPLLRRHCFECHAGDVTEADIDLDSFGSLSDVRRQIDTWRKVREMLASRQMPPKDASPLSDADRRALEDWVTTFLSVEAQATAGDPGPVQLRRLSNDEYNYVVRDLTGLSDLAPTDQFPVDGAAGEGFTNTGLGQTMSPSLVTKYVDAAKQVAAHIALYPDGIRFAAKTSARDLTDDALARIRAFYARYSALGGGSSVNLQGIQFETNQGGRLPLEPYLRVLATQRDALHHQRTTLDHLARQHGLSPKYLGKLWEALNGATSSICFKHVRRLWREATPNKLEPLIREITSWQSRLWKFNVVGHLGREGAPKSWLEGVSPISAKRSFRIALTTDRNDVPVRFLSETVRAGDGSHRVTWQDARLEGASLPPIPLSYVADFHRRLTARRKMILAQTPRYLEAIQTMAVDAELEAYAKQNALHVDVLGRWLRYLDIGSSAEVEVRGLYTDKIHSANSHQFIKGWGSHDTPSVLANSSVQDVRIPGIARARSVVVHPSPTLYSAIGWRSPMEGEVRVEAAVADAHPECGNGIEWLLQHRTRGTVTTLARGDFGRGGKTDSSGKTIRVRKGDLVSLLIGPRAGNHACDLSSVRLSLAETVGKQRHWDVAADTSQDILAANPHADRFGNRGVWHFYKGEMQDVHAVDKGIARFPSGSLVHAWSQADTREERTRLANAIRDLATSGVPPTDRESPDGVLFDDLQRIAVPLDQPELYRELPDAPPPADGAKPQSFATGPNSPVSFVIPSELAQNRELTATASPASPESAARVAVTVGDTDQALDAVPILCMEGAARRDLERQFQEFRELFPLALCYTRIVPVDEVVTAVLFHREDGFLQRLMLSDDESQQLDQLWRELTYVSQAPLKNVVALEQIREFSTQDRQDLVTPWDKLKPAVEATANAFKKTLHDSEPVHVTSVLSFARRAWKRPLTASDEQGLRRLYDQLRDTELDHETAIKLLVTRILTSPHFLYRRETPPKGSPSSPVTDQELATRLSFFLWSSIPDQRLCDVADARRLHPRHNTSTLRHESRRLLKDARVRRLAIQFACQWFHVRDFDRNDDKNEALYPEFSALRSDMYEETVRFLADLFRNNRSILDIVDADHTFLNGTLARHYGIENVTGAPWRRVNGVQAKDRGGILGMATFLASQSGASRTSPILRGNWVYETLLGKRLPRPPANVPVLPDRVAQGQTARQLIEQHSSAPECATCHSLIDPYGFALEQYDAIGRLRDQPADTKAVLPNGHAIEGLAGLREYLVTQRRDEVVRQFNRKLLGYALGREVQLSDEPLLDAMAARLKDNQYRVHVAIDSIVMSRQFCSIRGANHSD